MPQENATAPKPINSKLLRCNLKLNDDIMKFDPNQPIETNPVKALGLNSYYINMRHELGSLGRLSLEQRKFRMKERFIEDFLQEEKELAEVGLGFVSTQP